MTPLVLVFLWSCVQGSITVKNMAKETARIGGNVTLLCQLMTYEPNVIQITWHKNSGNRTGAVATTSKIYGQKIPGYYSNRTIHSTNSNLNVSAITISPVTPEDEGCFKCIFNLFPSGASSGKICLEVYEATLIEPTLEVHEIAYPDTLDKLYIFTCSATGKPAANIIWIVPETMDIAPEIYTTVNLNETETVISNFTLPISSIRDVVSMICVVRHPTLNSETHLSTTLHGPRNQDSNMKIVICTIPIVAGIVVGVAFLIKYTVCRKQDKELDSKSSKTGLLEA